MSATLPVVDAQLDQSSSLKTEAQTADNMTASSSADEHNHQGPPTPYLSSTPGSPYLSSRNSSFVGSESMREEFGETPPDKLTFFDIFENLALPMKLDRWQNALQAQKEKVKKQQERIRTTGNQAKDRAVAEWKKRAPTSDEQLSKYRKRVKKSVDDLQNRWNTSMTVTAKEKIAFLSAVLNIFLSGYLIGATPSYFYLWYTIQLAYFMPIRYYTYRKKELHYFVADLCYFVNLLCVLSIWAFPQSKRLFIGMYCLSYGNNLVAIIMWRNSLVFHSLDKVTSLFIHVMPPVTLHCIVHLTPDAFLLERFPAVHSIKFSPPGSKEHYSLYAMLLWATLPYVIWQTFYHVFITIRRADKIAAGRPTSFTWLRRSYAKTFLGKFVLSLPESLQNSAFMFIQYAYALLTILPCPLWFWYRWASAGFLLFVFSWSVYNGANYYVEVWGNRFQKEMEQMKKELAKWQNSPDSATTPMLTTGTTPGAERSEYFQVAADATSGKTPSQLLGMTAVDKTDDGRATGAQITTDADTNNTTTRRQQG